MPKPPKNSLGIMTTNSGPDLISEEVSRKIAEFEGIRLSSNYDTKRDWSSQVKEIEKTIPEEHRDEYRSQMNQIAYGLGEAIPYPENSTENSHKNVKTHDESYIIVRCSEDAIPEYNKLQLRKDPPTYIELQPGVNKLTVKEYPDLKKGFMQIDDYYLDLRKSPYEYNGGGIIEFDFSNFDGSEISSISHMFAWMTQVKKITFGKMHMPLLKNTECTFYRTGEDTKIDMLDLSGIDFSKVAYADYMFHGIKAQCVNLSNCDFGNLKNAEYMFDEAEIDMLDLSGIDFSKVSDADYMFHLIKAKCVNLSNCDFSNLENAECMFDEPEIDNLILDNTKFPSDLFDIILSDIAFRSEIHSISLRGGKETEIKESIETIKNQDAIVDDMTNITKIKNMEQKLITVCVYGGGYQDLTNNSELDSLLQDGWHISNISTSVTSNVTYYGDQDGVYQVVVILLEREKSNDLEQD